MQNTREKYPLISKYSKIYEVNKNNQAVIDATNQKMYSIDKKYVLVFDDDDQKKMYTFWEFSDWEHYNGHHSKEDEIYDNFLYELDPLFNHEKEKTFYEYELVIVKKFVENEDEKLNIMLTFESDNGPVSCLFSHEDSVTKGSSVLFGAIAVSENDKEKFFATISRKEKNRINPINEAEGGIVNEQ